MNSQVLAHSTKQSASHPFVLFPAIDLLDGRSVRLQKGARDSAEVVHPDPFEQLENYAQAGATWVHIVDLNSAFNDSKSHAGRISTRQIVQQIVAEGKLKLQVGGGVRSRAEALALLEMGVERVVVGTWGVRAPEEVCALAQEYPQLIVVGLDTVGGLVAVQGWTEQSKLPVAEFGKKLFEGGVRHALYTEVERDGMLTGVDAAAASRLHAETGLLVLASGGVRDVSDIKALAQTPGVWGVITGKALAAGSLLLTDALKYERSSSSF